MDEETTKLDDLEETKITNSGDTVIETEDDSIKESLPSIAIEIKCENNVGFSEISADSECNENDKQKEENVVLENNISDNLNDKEITLDEVTKPEKVMADNGHGPSPRVADIDVILGVIENDVDSDQENTEVKKESSVALLNDPENFTNGDAALEGEDIGIKIDSNVDLNVNIGAAIYSDTERNLDEVQDLNLGSDVNEIKKELDEVGVSAIGAGLVTPSVVVHSDVNIELSDGLESNEKLEVEMEPTGITVEVQGVISLEVEKNLEELSNVEAEIDVIGGESDVDNKLNIGLNISRIGIDLVTPSVAVDSDTNIDLSASLEVNEKLEVEPKNITVDIGAVISLDVEKNVEELPNLETEFDLKGEGIDVDEKLHVGVDISGVGVCLDTPSVVVDSDANLELSVGLELNEKLEVDIEMDPNDITVGVSGMISNLEGAVEGEGIEVDTPGIGVCLVTPSVDVYSEPSIGISLDLSLNENPTTGLNLSGTVGGGISVEIESNKQSLDLENDVNVCSDLNVDMNADLEVAIEVPSVDLSGEVTDEVQNAGIEIGGGLSVSIGLSGDNEIEMEGFGSHGNDDLKLCTNVELDLDTKAGLSINLLGTGNHEVCLPEPPVVDFVAVAGAELSFGRNPMVVEKSRGRCIREGEVKVNKGWSTEHPKNPDIHINVDMNEVYKKAAFKIEMPHYWSQKVVCLNEVDEEMKLLNSEQEFENLTSNLGDEERLNVEITMFIDKENLENSAIYACINLNDPNSQKDVNQDEDLIGVTYVANEELSPDEIEEQVHIKLEDSDKVNINGRVKEFDFRYQGSGNDPSLDIKDRQGALQNNEVYADLDIQSSKDDLKEETPIKRFDFRYQLPKFEIPFLSSKEEPTAPEAGVEIDVNSTLEESIESPTKRYDFRFQLPKIDLPLFRSNDEPIRGDVGSDLDSNVGQDANMEAPTKRFDFRYQLPKIDFPLFGSKEESLSHEGNTDLEVHADANIKVADSDSTISKKKRVHFIPPKVELGSLGGSGNDLSVSADHDVVPSDGDAEKGPPKRYDFRYQLPKVDIPLFGSQEKSNEDIVLDADLDIPSSDRDLITDNSPGKYHFRYQLPKMPEPKGKEDLPNAGELADISVDIDRKTSESDVTLESHSKRYDFRYQLPKIELPFVSKETNDTVDVEIEAPTTYISADVTVKSSEVDLDLEVPSESLEVDSQSPIIEVSLQKETIANVDIIIEGKPKLDISAEVSTRPPADDIEAQSPTKRYDFRFKLPSIDFIPLRIKPKSYNAVADIDVDDNISDINADLDVNSSVDSTASNKRHDFRFQLPKIEFPSFGSKEPSLNAEGGGEADLNLRSPGSDATSDSHSKRYDFRYQLPKIELSLFGSRNESPEIQRKAELDLQTDLDQKLSDTNKRYDFRYQLPNIELPGIGGKEGLEHDHPNHAVERPNLHTNINIQGSPDDLEIEGSLLNTESRYSLPELDKEANIEVEISSLVKSSIDDLDRENDTRRYDFIFTFPDTKFRTFNGTVHFAVDNADVEDDKNQFSVTFDGGDVAKDDIFQIILENGILKCSECYMGEWEPEVNSTVKCVSPNKNVLRVILPKSDSTVLVSFNDELIVKYVVKGHVDTLQRFTIEGAVKLNEAKLFGE